MSHFHTAVAVSKSSGRKAGPTLIAVAQAAHVFRSNPAALTVDDFEVPMQWPQCWAGWALTGSELIVERGAWSWAFVVKGAFYRTPRADRRGP